MKSYEFWSNSSRNSWFPIEDFEFSAEFMNFMISGKNMFVFPENWVFLFMFSLYWINYLFKIFIIKEKNIILNNSIIKPHQIGF